MEMIEVRHTTYQTKHYFFFCLALVTLSCSGPTQVTSGEKPKAASNASDVSSINPNDVPAVSASDTGSMTKSQDSAPKTVATLAALTNKPNLKLTAVPVLAELLDPTLPTTKSPSLKGEWVGLCFFDASRNSLECDKKRVFVNQNKTCPPGFKFREYGARTNAATQVWSATCIYDGELTDEQALNPAKFALTGALYGFCLYSPFNLFGLDSSKCFETMWPMKSDKTCPTGFQFVETASRVNGNDFYSSAACVLNPGSQRPAPVFSGTLSSLCVYFHNQNKCTDGKFGPNVYDKDRCSEGFSPSHVTSRYAGRDELWASICIKN
jgi:hypothetical protein